MKFAAKVICIGPVKMAEGIISPHSRTNVTETRRARIGGMRSSRKIGRASFAMALSRRSVTSKRWWSCSTGLMRLAASWFCLSRSFSSGPSQSELSASCITSSSLSSRETRPIVRPAAIAAQTMHTRAIPTLIQKRNDSSSSSLLISSGFLHTGQLRHTPCDGQVMVMACLEPPHKKAPSSHSRVYSPRYVVSPVHFPNGSSLGPQSTGAQEVPSSWKPRSHEHLKDSLSVPQSLPSPESKES
mmetsp:Transcript_78272/g.162576  ORF Transcript_78272/g.162576 Transcript_78272/m.162576 type:complete len:243 (+) Transcript_78272:1438-2166(+)